MNKECIYINGNVLVENEVHEKRIVDYQDNIEDVLLQENIIETIENKKNELISKKNKIDLKLKSKKSKVNYFYRAIFILCSLISVIMIPQMMFKPDLVNTIFGVFKLKDIATIFLSIIALVFNVGDIIAEETGEKNLKKECDHIENDLAFLNIQLGNEREKLEELKSEKTKENIPEGLKVSKIEDEHLLDEMFEKFGILQLDDSIDFQEEKGPELKLKR